MCVFNAPKPAPPPPPPPPPPEEPPVAPVFDEEKRAGESRDDARAVRRIGRNALRIDLQAPTATGDGLQAPKN